MKRRKYLWVANILLVLVVISAIFFRGQSTSARTVNRRVNHARPGTMTRTSHLAKNKPRILDAYGKLPMMFEANQGQTDRRVKFLSRGSGYTVFLTANEALLTLQKTSDTNTQRSTQ